MADFDQRKQVVGNQVNIKIEADTKDSPQKVFNNGLQLLHQKQYTLANQQFDYAIQLGVFTSDIYFYKALAMLGGKRPQSMAFNEIKEIEFLLQLATENDSACTHAYLLQALIKEDFYVNNKMPVNPYSIRDLLVKGCNLDKSYAIAIATHTYAKQSKAWQLLINLTEGV